MKCLRAKVEEISPGRFRGVGDTKMERMMNTLNFIANVFDFGCGDPGYHLEHGISKREGEHVVTSSFRRRSRRQARRTDRK